MRPIGFGAFAMLVAATAASLAAQMPPDVRSVFRVQVIDGATGEGIAGVPVAIRCTSSAPRLDTRAGSAMSSHQLHTDARGELAVDDIGSGQCLIYGAGMAGYSQDFRENLRPYEVGIGEVVRVIRLWPLATISGRVLDGQGIPVSGTPVHLQARLRAGSAQWSPYGSRRVTSDQDGNFRFDAVITGNEYRLVAPFVQLAQAPEPLVLAPGDPGSSVEMRGRVLPPLRVAGRVSAPDGAIGGLVVRLESASGAAASLGIDQSTTSPDGRFELLAPAGTYWVRINTTPTRPMDVPLSVRWADVELDVTSDIADLQIAVRSGFAARGIVQIERGAEVRDPPAAVLLGLGPAGGGPGARMIRVGDGRFATGELRPGRYVFRATGIPQGFQVKTVTVSGRDVSDAVLDLTTGSLDDVVVTLTDRVGGVAGAVRDAGGREDGEATVLIFPADERRWSELGDNSASASIRPASQRGNYSIVSLLPGDYLVAAVPTTDLPNIPGYDASLLRRAAPRASPIRVEPDRQTRVDLRTLPLSD